MFNVKGHFLPILSSYRHLASSAKKKVSLTDVTPKFEMDPIEQQMKQSLNSYAEEISLLRVGKAVSSMLDRIKVALQGQTLLLPQLAQVTVRDAQTLTVSAYDETTISAVEKAIRAADLSLNPSIENNIIRVPVPRLSKEHRDQMVKQISKLAEKSKIDIREIRQKAMKLLKNSTIGVSEDEIRNLEKKVRFESVYICMCRDIIENIRHDFFFYFLFFSLATKTNGRLYSAHRTSLYNENS
jgi:ribosome recycling factor